jgi:transaldolase
LATSRRYVAPDPKVVERVHDFILECSRPGERPLPAPSDERWAGLRGLGTDLWLDTGDIDGAARLWCRELTALTTNNTLLNAEVQKGIYDDLIDRAGKILDGLPRDSLAIEIAFILNAHHGLRLVQRFGARVSVELHTDLADDVEGAVAHGRRFHALSPTHFIVKVPLTPAGLIATRSLREAGVPVNFTLGFSARQNYLATRFASPSFVNLFLGRLGAYVSANQLGDGERVGEKATLASQRVVADLSSHRASPTLQIAASMRQASQVAALAGVDVMTLPLAVAERAREEQRGTWQSRRDADYEVALAPGADAASLRLETLWEVSEPVRRLATSLEGSPPRDAADILARAHELGAGDLLPRWTREDLEVIASDGKIPRHARWSERIRKRELAVDSLLNAAGLASFAADQKALDDRVRSLVL